MAEVFSHPFSIAGSFLPDCLADKINDIASIPAQTDHRTQEILDSFDALSHSDPTAVSKIYDNAIGGLRNFIKRNKTISGAVLCKFVLMIFGSKLLLDPTQSVILIEIATIYEEFKDTLNLKKDTAWFREADKSLLQTAINGIR